MVLFLGEAEVRELLNIDDAVHVLEEAFRQQGRGNIINHPRRRIRTPKSMLHYLPGAVPHMNVMGYKAYTSSKSGIKFRIFLHGDGILMSDSSEIPVREALHTRRNCH